VWHCAPLCWHDTDCSLIETEDGQLIALQGGNELGDFRAELHGEETGLEQFLLYESVFPSGGPLSGRPARRQSGKRFTSRAQRWFSPQAFHRIEDAPFVRLGDHFLPAVALLIQ